MRISDWSSDVCSSDLSSAIGLTKVSLASSDLSAACGSAKPVGRSFSKFSALEKRVDKSSSTLAVGVFAADLTRSAKLRFLEVIDQPFTENIFRNSRVKAFTSSIARDFLAKIGRASCRERVCQYV